MCKCVHVYIQYIWNYSFLLGTFYGIILRHMYKDKLWSPQFYISLFSLLIIKSLIEVFQNATIFSQNRYVEN